MGELGALRFWLDSILLSEYFPAFVSCGITTQQICANLDDALLINIGVNLPGHRCRILNHLPTAGSGRWIETEHNTMSADMDEPMPTIPPKTKSYRDSYLYQGDTTYQNIETLGATGGGSSSTPKPVPRPRTKSNQKTSAGDLKPQPMKRPTPAPRKTTKVSNVASPTTPTVPEYDSQDTKTDSTVKSVNPHSGSVKVIGVCTTETDTDVMPSPCVETGDSSQAQYNLFGNTPDTHFRAQTDQHDTNVTENTTVHDTSKAGRSEQISNDIQWPSNRDNDAIRHKGTTGVAKQESFENASFNTSLKKYVLKAEDFKDFDPLNALNDTNEDLKDGKKSEENANNMSQDLQHENMEETETTYEPIWVPPKNNNSPENTQINRASNLMEFSPLPNKQFTYSMEDSVQRRLGQVKAFKNRESFNMPPPTFAPPPLPSDAAPSGETTSDLDPATVEPHMPPVPPRPSNYSKSNSFKPYINFDVSGDSVTLPPAENMEPDTVISPQPIGGYTDAQVSMTVDPFQSKDPFGDFTPDVSDFDHPSSNSQKTHQTFESARSAPKPQPQPKSHPQPQQFTGIYEVAQEVPDQHFSGSQQTFSGSQQAFSGSQPAVSSSKPGVSGFQDEGDIYEMAEDPVAFDPFGLRSAPSHQPLPRTISNASSGSSSSYNLEVVPPVPNWSQRVPISSHVSGDSANNVEEDTEYENAGFMVRSQSLNDLCDTWDELEESELSDKDSYLNMFQRSGYYENIDTVRPACLVELINCGLDSKPDNVHSGEGGEVSSDEVYQNVNFYDSDEDSGTGSLHYLEDGDSSSLGSVEDILDPDSQDTTSHDDPMGNMSPVDILPPTALSPRKRERSGYLFKQGGIKQNKGWKKRWVIFDGKSLRYYANSKTQVSKRIVPLSCMNNVEMDVKARPLSRIMNSADIFGSSKRSSTRRTSDTSNPNNSRQFKFKLACTNRVFLFATDTLDDCKMWSSTLMEAIIKKPDGVEVAGGEMADPDIQGWIKINRNRLKFWVCLKKHKFCYYQSIDDYNMASPLHEIDMKLSAVKEVERTKLQLSTHYSQFMLNFESSSDAANWKMAIEEAITDALGDNTILDQVKENPDNVHCADCGAKESHWASMNLGIVLCVKCAGIHRGFDYKMSKIRSLRMDTKVWNSSLIEMFKEIGNKNANSFWLRKQVIGQGIDDSTPPKERRAYIFSKYKDKQFCDLHPLAGDHAKLNEALLDAAQTSDVLLTMRILLSGADVLYTRPGDNSTAYELAKDARQRIQMEFLLQNGGDRTQNFMPGSEEASLVAKLRAEVQLVGYLLKTGSNMKDFLRRWVVLEHGHISYYDSEESKVENDRIDNDAILCMQTNSTERHQFCFEISTKKGNNRVYLFSAVSDEERIQWMRYIAQIFCPVNLMDQMKQKDFCFCGWAYMKTGFNKEWQRTWYVLEKRKLFFTDKEQQEREEDSLDLRKVTNITKITDKGMDTCDACLEQGPQFVLNAPDKALYLQADLTKDTERMFSVLEFAIKKGGDILEDQPLDSSDVPVIISQCVNFIQLHGQKMRGIYREAAQDSKIKALLERFREDARSVVLRMEDHTVHEVCNVLKRFLRNLSDPLLTTHLYNRWIQTAEESDHNVKMHWYKYLLQQLPRANYLTLLCLATHLHQLSEHASENLMTLDNISIAFGSTLMKSNTTPAAVNPNNIGGAMQMEMKVISDIITYYQWMFDLQESDDQTERFRLAEEKILAITAKTMAKPDDFNIYVNYLDPRGNSESVKVDKETTAQDVIKILVSKMKLPTNKWSLHEMIKEELERPLHSQTKLLPLIMEWPNWAEKYSTEARLVLKPNKLKEEIEKAYDPCKLLFAEMKYAEKKGFKKMAFEFTHAKLSCYKDLKNVNNAFGSWNIEDLSVYKGYDSSHKARPPTKWTFSFICKGDKVGGKDLPAFGRCVCCNSEQELMSWLAGMMMAQHPSGFS